MRRSLWDAVLGERGAEQEIVQRHEEKSLLDRALVIPPHNCVLSTSETARIGSQQLEPTYTTTTSKCPNQLAEVFVHIVYATQSHNGGLGLKYPCLDIENVYFGIKDRFKLQMLWPR